MDTRARHESREPNQTGSEDKDVTSFLGGMLVSDHDSGVAPSDARHDPRPRMLVDLYTEHQYVLRLLELLEEMIMDLPNETSASSISQLDRAHAVTQYLNVDNDPRHHRLEDLIADRLLARRAIARHESEKLAAEHIVLARKSRALGESVDMVLRKGHPHHKLDAQVRKFAGLWRSHIKHEERVLLPQAAKSLTARDWKEIGKQIGTGTTPFLSGEIPEHYADMFQYLRERVVRIGSDSGSLSLIQAAEAIAERLEILSWGQDELWDAFAESGRRMCDNQHELMRHLVKSDSVASAVGLLGNWAGSTMFEAIQMCKLPWEIVLTTGQSLITQPSSPDLTERKTQGRSLASIVLANLQSRGNKLYALNLVLRMLIKRQMKTADLDSFRNLYKPIMEFLAQSQPKDIVVQDANIDSVNAEWVYPIAKKTSQRVVLYIPGGAFLIPASPQHRELLTRITRALHARGLLLHYRLAPEHPFPANLEDCIAAYRHLLAKGIDPKRVVIMGDSAGGGLTLSTLLALRDAGDPMPGAAVVLSPLADLTYSGASRIYNRWHDPVLPTTRAVDIHELYLKDTPASHPLVSPIFGDYSGLPPILAQVGSSEMLLDDTLRMAARARAQAVSVDVEIWHDMPHVWQLINALPESKEAVGHIANFVRQHLPDDSKGIPASVFARADAPKLSTRPKAHRAPGSRKPLAVAA